jgi:TonB family protein
MHLSHQLIICAALVPFVATASPGEPAFPNLKVVDVKQKRPTFVDDRLMAYPKSAVALSPPCGRVILAVAVSEAGDVSDVRVVRSEPPDVFDGPAIRAIRAWRYAPEYEGGKAIPFQVVVPFAYKLEGTTCPYERPAPVPAN